MDWIDKRILSIKQVTGFGYFLKIGSAAAFTAALLFRRNLDAEYSLLSIFGILEGSDPYPNTVTDWFFLFQEKPFIGLLLLNFFDLINFILIGLFFSAVIILLYRERRTPAITSAFLTTAGVVLSLISNPALAILSFSGRYGMISFEDQRNLISIAEKLLEVHANNAFQGSGIYPSFFLVSTAGLMLSFIMLKSNSFNRITAVIGILANVIGLTYYPFLVLLPGQVFLPLSVSAVFLLAWYILIGSRLWRLSSRPEIPLKR
ncbi:MAG: hypothetical protein AB9891_19235 [Anaerolineaceae bacterium]